MTTQDNSQREVNEWLHWVAPDGQLVPRTWESLESGALPWSVLDDEELSKGKLRDVNGQFRGSSLMPRKMVPQLTRRLKERYDDKLREQLLALQQVHIEIALDPNAPSGDRLRAASYATERLIGKVPDKVEVIAEVKPWEGLVGGVLVDVPDSSAE